MTKYAVPEFISARFYIQTFVEVLEMSFFFLLLFIVYEHLILFIRQNEKKNKMADFGIGKSKNIESKWGI